MSEEFLAPGRYIDSDAPSVVAFAQEAAGEGDDALARVLRLYRAVRDGIVYDPYVDMSDPANFRASGVLAAGRGFCIGKAAVLAACCRVIGVEARVGYADVRNHLSSPRLTEHMGSDVYVWHSYADILIDGAWVKATPAFNAALCRRLGLEPLAFDGRSDSLLHPYDRAGRVYMEYLADHGTFADVPYDIVMAAFRAHYPAMMAKHGLTGDFQAEAVAGEAARQDA
ncbi:MAG TPA: transglutaminase family protein [Xanthobacteraceae bacterium]|nr:transglutaminase family protein [Xanthobacteraceae bacterium]